MPARQASLTALATLWLGVTDDDHERRDVAELLAAMPWRPDQEGRADPVVGQWSVLLEFVRVPQHYRAIVRMWTAQHDPR